QNELETAQKTSVSEQAAIEDEEFRTRRLNVYLAKDLHRDDTDEFRDDNEYVQQRLTEENARNDAIAKGQLSGQEPSMRYHELEKEVTSVSKEDKLKMLREEQELAQENVNTAGFIAGDTAGVFIAEHPEWTKKLLPKLIALGPQGKKGYSRAGAPPWDDL